MLVLKGDKCSILHPLAQQSRMAGANLLTIGAAFYHALRITTSDYILFLEKDFSADRMITQQEILLELLSGM